MKKKLNVGVVVTLSGRWPRELPEKRFKEYGEWTINAFPECNVVRFDRVVCTKEDMDECIDSLLWFCRCLVCTNYIMGSERGRMGT